MSLQIIFMGTPEFSINTLKLLIDNGHEILRVYTQPPKKAKRTQNYKNTTPHSRRRIKNRCKDIK